MRRGNPKIRLTRRLRRWGGAGIQLPEQEKPSIAGLLHKTLFGGSLEKAKENLNRWFVEPNGIENFNKDITAALQSPEAAAFGALDPMVGIVTPVSKAAQIAANTGKAIATKTPEISALEKVVGMEKFDPRQMEDLAAKAKSYGIELTVPELTNSPTLRGLWTRLAKTPGPEAEKIATYLEEVRKPQVEDAIKRELNNISPVGTSPRLAGGSAAKAAESIENRLISERAMGTRKLYKSAWENKQPVDISEPLKTIQEEIAKLPDGSIKDTLRKVERTLTRDAEEAAGQIVSEGGIAGPVGTKRIPHNDVEILHNSKVQIDKILSQAAADNAIDNNTSRLVTRVQHQVKNALENSNPLYRDAQRTYRLLSGDLRNFQYADRNLLPRDKRVKTLIANMADAVDRDFDSIPGMVFREPKEIIGRTRQWFQKNHPGTWDALVKSYLEDRLHSIPDTVIEREGNVGGVFKRTVFNTQNIREKLQTALGPDKFKQLEGFMQVLDKTRRIIYTNSETAYQIAAGEILNRGGIEEKISNIPTSKGGVLKWIAGKFDQLQKPKFAAQLADAMLDPKNAIEISRIRRMPDNPRKAFATTQFLDTAVFKVGSHTQDPVTKKIQGIDDELRFRGR